MSDLTSDPLPGGAREELRKPLNPDRVVTGQSGPLRGVKYLESHDVIFHANRIFGEGNWGFTAERPFMLEAGKQGQNETPYEVWACLGTLTVRGGMTFSDVGTNTRNGTGSSGLEMAYKGAVSDAMKRCLRMYGDQFGLVLYDKLADVAELWANEHGGKAEPAKPPASPLAKVAQELGATPALRERLEGASPDWRDAAIKMMSDLNLTPTDVSKFIDGPSDWDAVAAFGKAHKFASISALLQRIASDKKSVGTVG